MLGSRAKEARMARKKHLVVLTDDERQALEPLVWVWRESARKITRARLL